MGYLHRGVSRCQWFTEDWYGHWHLAAWTLWWRWLWTGWCCRQSCCCCCQCCTFCRRTPVIRVQLTTVCLLSTITLTAVTTRLSVTFSTKKFNLQLSSKWLEIKLCWTTITSTFQWQIRFNYGVLSTVQISATKLLSIMCASPTV